MFHLFSISAPPFPNADVFFSLAQVKLDQTVQKGKGTFEVSFDTWTLGCGEAENAVVEMMI